MPIMAHTEAIAEIRSLAVGTKLRLSRGGEHVPQLLHVRGIVDDQIVAREWWPGKNRWVYAIHAPSWWAVNREYLTVERGETA